MLVLLYLLLWGYGYKMYVYICYVCILCVCVYVVHVRVVQLYMHIRTCDVCVNIYTALYIHVHVHVCIRICTSTTWVKLSFCVVWCVGWIFWYWHCAGNVELDCWFFVLCNCFMVILGNDFCFCLYRGDFVPSSFSFFCSVVSILQDTRLPRP